LSRLESSIRGKKIAGRTEESRDIIEKGAEMKVAVTIAITAVIAALTATPAPAGGEPSYSYPPPTPPYPAPPVIVAAPPLNPLASIVLGAIGLPFTVLGGIATAVASPVVVSCIAPDGSLFPCAGPTPGPGYGPQEPYPPASATYADPPRPTYGQPSQPPGHGEHLCYDGRGRFIGGDSPECAY
jgi:hypothetical protein